MARKPALALAPPPPTQTVPDGKRVAEVIVDDDADLPQLWRDADESADVLRRLYEELQMARSEPLRRLADRLDALHTTFTKLLDAAEFPEQEEDSEDEDATETLNDTVNAKARTPEAELNRILRFI